MEPTWQLGTWVTLPNSQAVGCLTKRARLRGTHACRGRRAAQWKAPGLLNGAGPVTETLLPLGFFPPSCPSEGVALCPFFPGLLLARWHSQLLREELFKRTPTPGRSAESTTGELGPPGRALQRGMR